MEVEFIYEDQKIIIHCNSNDKMIDVCRKFESKIHSKIESTFFLYQGENLNLQSTCSEVMNSNDKETNSMTILALLKEDSNSNTNKLIMKSKSIICPECGENIRFKTENYLIIKIALRYFQSPEIKVKSLHVITAEK